MYYSDGDARDSGENLADAVRQLARVMVIFCVLTLALVFCLWRQKAAVTGQSAFSRAGLQIR